MTDVTEVTELTWEQASRELDDIVTYLESSDVDVDQLVERLRRAAALVDGASTGASSPRAPRSTSCSRGCSAPPSGSTRRRARCLRN